MNLHSFSTALLSVFFAASTFALAPGERVDNFRLLDETGSSHELYYFSDTKAFVLMAHNSSCQSMQESVEALASMQASYADQGVEFMLINSDLRDDRSTIQASVADQNIAAPVLMDSTQIIGESLGAMSAGDTVVIDPSNWQVAYLGGAQNASQAVASLVKGQSPQMTLDSASLKQAASADCAVDYPELANRAEHANISYSDTIAPLLSENCVTCHRVGGIGPFAMSDYNIVRGFSLMIREVVRTQRMPPWHADPHFGEFSNNRALSDEEVRTLVHWVEAGAPRGEGADLLAEQRRSWPKWAMGEPDVIIEIPTENIPASGVVDYKYKMVANPLDKDVWVKATEIIPGDRAVLHHVITSFGEVATEGRRAGRLKRGTGGGLGGYVPGAEGTPYPDNSGVFLPADATIEFQMHYTTSGLATSDTSYMGVYLHKEKPEHELESMVLLNPRIRIPAGDPNHMELAQRTVDKDILVYSLLPHAHFRGKASEFVAQYPDGTEEKLLSVPRYDFNWQTTYSLDQPKLLPAGTQIVHRTWWDNSARNPANPDATRVVPWGEQSWDEMLFGAIRYRVVGAGEAEQIAASSGGE
ncbi:redoxin domain-containing protein [Pseudomonadales bacterium]|nr:redoxin domain-containing protein [Pseudomonadales bacterium]MDB2595922.1 redoxin domain-containing protein [Pseudomonadales bacterium]MDB9756195.1 redoxin domain-containing protein [Pseudomonadales bacterium]